MIPVPAPAGAGLQPLFRDGFGARWLAIDPDGGDAVEVLSFADEFVDAPDVAGAVGERVARLALVRHSLYARVRRLDRPTPVSLFLYSDYVRGWRLADVLQIASRERLPIDISTTLVLLRQLIPAVALFSRHQRDAAIGTIGPERLILTPEGRLVIADYVLAPGIERLHYSRERLWRELRVALAPYGSPAHIVPASDVVGIGVVALSMLIGRPLEEDEYLNALGDLLELATEKIAGTSRPLSARFAQWVARALQFDGSGFQSPHEAQVAFEEMLARDRAYMTTPAQLDLFIARVERIVGLPAGPAADETDGGPATTGAAERPPSGTHSAMPAAVTAGPRPSSGRRAAVQAAPVPVPPAAPDARPPAEVRPAAIGEAPSTSSARMATRRPPSALERGRRWLDAAFTGGAEARQLRTALIVIVVVQAGLLGWATTRGGGGLASDYGELVVQSRPLAARVIVDGEERGTAPLSMPLRPGAHVLEVRVGRAEPRVIPVQIRAGVQSALYVELQSVATVGALDVRSDPPGATVTIDGRRRGVTPLVLRDLAPGDHDVLLEADGRELRHTARVEPGVTTQLVVPMSLR